MKPLSEDEEKLCIAAWGSMVLHDTKIITLFTAGFNAGLRAAPRTISDEKVQRNFYPADLHEAIEECNRLRGFILGVLQTACDADEVPAQKLLAEIADKCATEIAQEVSK